MRAGCAVLLVLVAACHRPGDGVTRITRDVHRKTTQIVGVPGAHVGTYADARPALEIMGVTGALAEGMKQKLASSSIASKGNLAIDVAFGSSASPSGDGRYSALLRGDILFAHPPQLIRLQGTIDVKLTYTNASTEQIGEALGDVVLDWFTGDQVPADVGLPAGKPAPVVHVAVGRPSCTLHGDGSVRCWESDLAATPVTAASHTVSLDAALNYGACGIRANGTAYCIDAWDNTVALEVRDVCGIANAKAISVGDSTACALLADGHVRCWRRGPEWFAPCDGHASPIQVDDVGDAVAITVGPFTGCATGRDGRVSCWAQGDDARKHFQARPVPELARARSVIVYYTPCGVIGPDRVACVRDKVATATDVRVPEPVTQLAAGEQLCELAESGDVYCGFGGLAPAKVAGVADLVQIDGDLAGLCGVTRDGDAICWGDTNGLGPPKKVALF